MQQTLFKLPVSDQISPYLTLRQKGEIPVIVVDHPKVRAVIALQGAQLLAWQPKDAEQVIWLSNKTSFTQGKAIRGGVPICWPWFADGGKPAHGFARTELWQLLAHHEDADGVNLTFELKHNEHTLKIWPHEFCLIARFRLAKQCHIEIEAWGEYSSTAALHSYFKVADIEQVSVSGLGRHFIDKVAKTEHSDADGTQTYHGQVDRIYTSPEEISVIHQGQQSPIIEVMHQQVSDVVTWNPGAELSSSMTDMESAGYKTMVCVETARISHPMQSRSEQPATLGVTIAVKA